MNYQRWFFRELFFEQKKGMSRYILDCKRVFGCSSTIKVLSITGYSIVWLSDEEEEEDEDDEDYDEDGVDASDGSGRKKKRKKKKRRRMAGRKSKGTLSDKPQDFQVRENNRKALLSIYHTLFDWYLKGLGVFKAMLSLCRKLLTFLRICGVDTVETTDSLDINGIWDSSFVKLTVFTTCGWLLSRKTLSEKEITDIIDFNGNKWKKLWIILSWNGILLKKMPFKKIQRDIQNYEQNLIPI